MEKISDKEKFEINALWEVLQSCECVNLGEDREKIVKFLLKCVRTYESKRLVNEIRKADLWLYERGKSKKNYYRYLGNWFRRSTSVSFLWKERGQNLPVVRQCVQSQMVCKNSEGEFRDYEI